MRVFGGIRVRANNGQAGEGVNAPSKGLAGDREVFCVKTAAHVWRRHESLAPVVVALNWRRIRPHEAIRCRAGCLPEDGLPVDPAVAGVLDFTKSFVANQYHRRSSGW